MNRPLLCRLGWHRYEPWAFDHANPLPVERCPRCGVGRQYVTWCGGFVVAYTAEQMDELGRMVEDREALARRPPDLRIVS